MISRDDLATVDGVLVGTTRNDLRCFLSASSCPQEEQTRVLHAGPIYSSRFTDIASLICGWDFGVLL